MSQTREDLLIPEDLIRQHNANLAWLNTREGGEHVALKKFAEARIDYGRALGQPIASQLLSNISATLFNQQDFEGALTFAAAASVAAAGREGAAAKKGRHRATSALRALGAAPEEVAWWAGEAGGSAELAVRAAVARGGRPLPLPEGSADADPEALKAAGNELFSKQDLEGALRQYLLGLRALPIVAAALRNRSLCSFEVRWPLHDIVITNVVWCVAYKRDAEGGSYIAQ